MLPFARASVIGLGLIGFSIARAVRQAMPTVRLTGHDADPAVREAAVALGLCDDVADQTGAAVIDADLEFLCVPVGAIAAVAADLPPDVVVSDVGSSKAGAARGRSRSPSPASRSSSPAPSRAPSEAVPKRVSRRCSGAAGASWRPPKPHTRKRSSAWTPNTTIARSR